MYAKSASANGSVGLGRPVARPQSVLEGALEPAAHRQHARLPLDLVVDVVEPAVGELVEGPERDRRRRRRGPGARAPASVWSGQRRRCSNSASLSDPRGFGTSISRPRRRRGSATGRGSRRIRESPGRRRRMTTCAAGTPAPGADNPPVGVSPDRSPHDFGARGHVKEHDPDLRCHARGAVRRPGRRGARRLSHRPRKPVAPLRAAQDDPRVQHRPVHRPGRRADLLRRPRALPGRARADLDPRAWSARAPRPSTRCSRSWRTWAAPRWSTASGRPSSSWPRPRPPAWPSCSGSPAPCGRPARTSARSGGR